MGNKIKPFVAIVTAVLMKMVLRNMVQVADHCPYSSLEFDHFANELLAERSLKSLQKLPQKWQLQAIPIHLTPSK